MPASLVTAIGYVTAASLGGVATYYWRRSTGLYALLVEGANRYEEMRLRVTQLEQAIAKNDEKTRLHKEQTQRLEKGIDDAREKSAELVRKLESKEHELKLVSEKLELQKGHLEKQLGKALDQIRAHDDQRDADKVRGAAQLTELEHRLNLARQELHLNSKDAEAKTRELSGKLRELERDTASKQAKAIDPEELKRMRRKLAQFDRLYASMKGLREMAEERNRNWEVALERLSAWILRETMGPLHPMPTSIGPMVGQALQAIGAQLIDDNEMPQRPEAMERSGGAEHAESMDLTDSIITAVDDDGDEAREAALHPERIDRLQDDL